MDKIERALSGGVLAPSSWRELREALNPSYVGFVTQPLRVGSLSFFVFLEYNHFKPDTPMNRFYSMFQITFCDIPLMVCVIPKRHLDKADELMKSLGLRRVDGVPHVCVGGTGPGSGWHHFPIDQPNLWTLEHSVPGHFAYSNNPLTQETALDAEQAAVDRVINDHRRRYAAGEFDHDPGTLPPSRL